MCCASCAGVSRKTGYKWVARYESGGVAGARRSIPRAARPIRTPCRRAVVDAIVAARRRHPRWGPRKLLALLAPPASRRRRGRSPAPSATSSGATASSVRVGAGTSSAPYDERLPTIAAPNAIWCADFKGHFAVGDARCHPLTIMDGFSRYLLRCRRRYRARSPRPCRTVFTSAFREFGLPDGDPHRQRRAVFDARRRRPVAVGGVVDSPGIRPERILPGRPDQNGRHERMHSTLKAETARPPRSSFRAQQRCFDALSPGIQPRAPA